MAALRAAAEEVRSRVADLHELGLMRTAAAPSGQSAAQPGPPASLVDAVRSTLL